MTDRDQIFPPDAPIAEVMDDIFGPLDAETQAVIDASHPLYLYRTDRAGCGGHTWGAPVPVALADWYDQTCVTCGVVRRISGYALALDK